MQQGDGIARVDVIDAEGGERYVAVNGEAVARFHAGFLVRGGVFEAVEGPSRSRIRVIERGGSA